MVSVFGHELFSSEFTEPEQEVIRSLHAYLNGDDKDDNLATHITTLLGIDQSLLNAESQFLGISRSNSDILKIFIDSALNQVRENGTFNRKLVKSVDFALEFAVWLIKASLEVLNILSSEVTHHKGNLKDAYNKAADFADRTGDYLKKAPSKITAAATGKSAPIHSALASKERGVRFLTPEDSRKLKDKFMAIFSTKRLLAEAMVEENVRKWVNGTIPKIATMADAASGTTGKKSTVVDSSTEAIVVKLKSCIGKMHSGRREDRNNVDELVDLLTTNGSAGKEVTIFGKIKVTERDCVKMHVEALLVQVERDGLTLARLSKARDALVALAVVAMKIIADAVSVTTERATGGIVDLSALLRNPGQAHLTTEKDIKAVTSNVSAAFDKKTLLAEGVAKAIISPSK